jgi:FtsZ-binding cell division protein ZapB
MNKNDMRSLNSLEDIEFAVTTIDDLERRHKHALHKIDVLEDEIEKLKKALDIYQRERDRFRHAKPEITGEYFLAGGHGERDDNMLPEFVRIVPAYGCAWEQVYVKTDKTISYEGS